VEQIINNEELDKFREECIDSVMNKEQYLLSLKIKLSDIGPWFMWDKNTTG
jgi:hypothetical protein